VPVGSAMGQLNVPDPLVAPKVAPAGRLLAVSVMASSPTGSVALTAKLRPLLKVTNLFPMAASTGASLVRQVMTTEAELVPSLSAAKKRVV
jgi:hypothetical protein